MPMRSLLVLLVAGVSGLFLCAEAKQDADLLFSDEVSIEENEDADPLFASDSMEEDDSFFSAEIAIENKKETKPSQSSASLPESIAKGNVLFTKHCVVCHGKDGRGKTPIGKTVPNMPNFTSPSTKEKSDEELFDIITNGHAPMPSFKSLSEEDRHDLVDYVRSFSSPSENQ